MKSVDEDFEWYPTTKAIIDEIRTNMEDRFTHGHPRVLDCGCGDGRVLSALTEGSRYGIEKSRPLLDSLDRSIYVVGTEFREQTLIDKKVGVVFSNPPYSEYVDWAEKIITQANAPIVYLVLPQRWINDTRIQDALARRRAKYEILGTHNFLDAERQARAVVNTVRVELGYEQRSNVRVDPFTIWFEDVFQFNLEKPSSEMPGEKTGTKEEFNTRLKQSLVEGGDLLTSLVELYQDDMDTVSRNYHALSQLDPDLLSELGVSVAGLQQALKQRIEGLKHKYWQELFDHLDKITQRLTQDSRTKMLERLTTHTDVDFTKANAQAVLG
ncbi:MAG: DUF4942 domain-containing protein [Pseudomonadales bacterium]|nr:DUF4942 domain-containing protein [Pseudomonadales bacterium]